MQKSKDWACRDIFEAMHAKGFWRYRDILFHPYERLSVDLRRTYTVELISSLALITTEIAEAIEAVRKNPDWTCVPSEHVPSITALEEELADAVIRIRDLCGGLDIDLDAAIASKMEFNLTRPQMHDKSA